MNTNKAVPTTASLGGKKLHPGKNNAANNSRSNKLAKRARRELFIQQPTTQKQAGTMRDDNEGKGKGTNNNNEETNREQNGKSKRSKSEQSKEASASWEKIQVLLRARVGSDVFESWFGRMKVEEASGGVAVLSVPTAFLRSWICEKYLDVLLELWKGQDKSILRVDVVRRTAVRSHMVAKKDTTNTTPSAQAKDSGIKQVPPANKFDPETGYTTSSKNSGILGSPLDPRHTFDSFMEGASNRMAFAAARSVAEDTTGTLPFNPLCIHSSVGLGKTHLLQAIAWETRKRDPRKKVLYLTAEYFVWRFADAIKNQTALSLKESLRDIDLLLIDDLQFLKGKSIQDEFCHLLNELIDSARQVVIAADQPAAEIDSLDKRVRSRIKGGATLEIAAPDYELRKEIINSRYQEAKLQQPNLLIPDDIRHYVARKVTTNGRDLEGAFNQLLVKHRFSDGIISFEELDRLLGHLIESAENKRVRIEDIQRVVSRQFNVPRNELLSDRRTRTIVVPRQIAMYLSKIMTPRSLPEIGRRFGGRDHTTVLHAVRKIEQLCLKDQKMAHEIELLKRYILDM